MLVGIVLVNEAVVVDKILIAGVVGWVDIDAFHFTRMGHTQESQGIKIVALNDEVAEWRTAAG